MSRPRYLGADIDSLRSQREWIKIPEFILRSPSGRMDYLLGRYHNRVPRSWCRRMSSFPDW